MMPASGTPLAWAALLGLLAGGCGDGGSGQGSALFGSPKETPPADGAYTIRLTTFGGPDHVAQATHSKQATGKATGWQGLYVVHEATDSSLYWGSYPSEKAAQKDLQRARTWTSPSRLQPFAMAVVVARPGTAVGPPQWDLAKSTGDYTVVVAEFYNDPSEGVTDRERDAVEACREYRARGYEAYYYHGPAKSFMTIGSFLRSSFTTAQVGPDVATTAVNDERLAKIFREFPILFINGYEEAYAVRDPVTGEVTKRWSNSTYVMGVPGRATTTKPSGSDPRRFPQLR